ncbi:hypothetical protein GSI_04558 [Ganoderma sinense ZZ0214-1]|uniref:Uncharacterized protein n=1 Tax=Ganoderma sinense ZZ0214-1 TaxID=1077348 RepID=A0A2G8SH56_9APHY|nr:hypothetical protein GSI_04558 [Ganoderma sinense ZZ0214-1]
MRAQSTRHGGGRGDRTNQENSANTRTTAPRSSALQAAAIFLSEEHDKDGHVVPEKYPATPVSMTQRPRVEPPHLYFLDRGVCMPNNVAVRSLSAPPSAFLSRCVAALPSDITNRFSAPHCLYRTVSSRSAIHTGSASGEYPPTGSRVPNRFRCASLNSPTSPTASSLVRLSQSPSVAMIRKSPGFTSISVTSGSAVRYGGVLTSGRSGLPWCPFLSRSWTSRVHLYGASPKAREMPMPSTRPFCTTVSPGCSACRRSTSAWLRPLWSVDRM